MLELSNIEVVYSNVIQVLRGISLVVKGDQIISMLGGNGAGKSTTLKAISGLLKVDEGDITAGEIVFQGERIDRMEPEAIALKGITQIIEGRRVLEHLTVRENLLVGGYSRKKWLSVKKELNHIYDFFPRLMILEKKDSGLLSGGEKQMLVIGRALMAHPRLMLIDEASLGLAPIVITEIYKVIRKINGEDKTAILLVEQNAAIALEISSYGYVMENGRVVLEGTSDKLQNNEDVKEFYLGLSNLGEKSYRDVKHYKRRKRWLG
jgi:branched-chain amino acid transport system ATP-binding protein